MFSRFLPLLVIASLVTCIPFASAQVASDTLDQVVITAYRYENPSINIPASISLYTEADQRRLNPRSMAEALIGVPGVWMQKTNHGGGSPFVRGLTGNQTLLLIDGIRMNNSTYRYGPNQYLNTFDPLIIGQVEVLRGAASVQYGSDALGGAVHILTKGLALTDTSSWGGRLYGKFMADEGFSETMELSTRGEVEFSSDRLAFRLGASWKDFGNLIVGGDSLQIFSSYQEQDWDAKALIQLSKNQQLTLAHQRVNQEDVGRFDQVVQRGREFFFFDPQRRSLSYARWKMEQDHPWLKQLQATLSFQNSLEGRRQKRQGESTISREQDQVETWGFSLELQSRPLPQWTILSGLEYYGDHIQSEASTEEEDTGVRTARRGLYPDGANAHNYAVFSLHTWETQNWVFSGGLRLNGVSLLAEDGEFGDLNLAPWALVGNVGALYKIQGKQRIFASFNTGFRAPNINDVSSFGSFDSGIEVPNDDLAPERTQTWELGYKAQTAVFSAHLALFHTQLRNLITRVPTSFRGSELYNGEPVFHKENVDKATIQGIEGQFQLPFPQGKIFTHLNYTYGEDSDGGPLRRIPPLNGRTGVSYHWGDSPFSIRGECLYASKQDRLSGGDIRDHRIPDGGTPGWAVVNLYGSWETPTFDIHLGLQNLTDKLYRMHGSGVDAYGRSLWIQLAYSW